MVAKRPADGDAFLLFITGGIEIDMNKNPVISIVDDDPAVRDSLSLLLQTHGFVVHGFESGDAFLSGAAAQDCDCVMLDVRMPGKDGLEVLSELRTDNPDLCVIMMSGHADVAMAVRALKLGAMDFFEKPFKPKEILAVIARARAAKSAAADNMARQCLAKLTPREREVAAQLAAGKPNKIVASDLGISVRTVETHRARLMSKLELKSLSGLVRLWIEAHAQPKA